MKHKQDEILIQSLPGSLDNVNFIVNHDKNNMKHFHEISGLIKEMIYEQATAKAVEIPNKNGSITYVFKVNKASQKQSGVSQVRVVLGKDAVRNLELVENEMTMKEVMESYSDAVVNLKNERRLASLGKAIKNVVLAGGITGAALFGLAYATDVEQPNGFDQLAPEVQQDMRNRGYVTDHGYDLLSDELKEKISFDEFYGMFGYDVLNGNFDMDQVEEYAESMGHSR